MTKVLFVCTVPTDKSGIPNVIFNIINNIDYNRYEIGYVSINEPSAFYKSKLKNIKSKLFIIPRKIKNPLRYISKLVKVAKGYDVIHVHGNSATMVLEMIAAKIAGVKVRIAHSHNTTCNMKTIDKLARPLFYRLSNGRLACGIEAGRWLFRKRDFLVINNGIDIEKFRFNANTRKTVRSKMGLHDNDYVIGHIGNFVEQKNHSFLIDIFHKFTESQSNSKLLLLGDGPLKFHIQSKVTDLGLSKQVIFAGSVDHPEEFMNAMDMVVMPSLFEGLPLTLIEEQANGLSIVAADTITTDANITGNVKFLSLSEDINIWVKSIKRILSENLHCNTSSDKAIDMIKQAKYDIESSVETLDCYYETKLQS